MKDVNGYAIYHDLLHTTRPASWQRLLAEHTRPTNPLAALDKPRKSSSSSFDRSSYERVRHATGRLARLLLATPSDPELKTYSKRAPPDINPRQFAAAAMPWLNPMAMSAYAGATSDQTWTSSNKKDKGKQREVRPIAAEGIGEHDFAPSVVAPTTTAPSRLPASTVANSNTRWTGTTAVPSTQAVRAAEHDMRKYEAGNNLLQPPANIQASVVSEESAWPESDSQGNWFDAKKARLRGGGKSKKDKKKEEEKKVRRWVVTPERSEAMHLLM